MSLILGALLLGLSAPSIEVGPRTPSVLLLVTPRASKLRGSTSDYLLAADAIATSHTGLQILSSEQAGVDQNALDRCGAGERLTCWTRLVRPREDAEGPRFLIVLAAHPSGADQTKLVAMLVDTDRALEAFKKTPRSAGWRERVESELFTQAVKTKPKTLRNNDNQAIRGYFEDLFSSRFRSVLERESLWRPFGQVSLQAPPGATIALDGRRVGVAGPSPTELSAIPPGRVTISIRTPDGRAAQAQVTVERGQRVELTPASFVFPPDRPHPLRLAVQWGGIAVATAGAAIAIYGLTQSLDDVNSACITRGAQSCPSLGQPTFDYDPGRGPAVRPEAINPGGLLVGAFGLSLVSAGLSWALGTWFFGEPAGIPWIPLAAGAALGGATYGLGAALDRR